MTCVQNPVDFYHLLLIQEIIKVTPVFFCRAPDLARALAGMKSRGLELQALDFFGGRDINVEFYGFFITQAVVQQATDFYLPPSGFRFNFVFIAFFHGMRSPGGRPVPFHLSAIAGRCGLCPRLKKTDRPEVFVEAQFFFFSHWCINQLPGTEFSILFCSKITK